MTDSGFAAACRIPSVTLPFKDELMNINTCIDFISIFITGSNFATGLRMTNLECFGAIHAKIRGQVPTYSPGTGESSGRKIDYLVLV